MAINFSAFLCALLRFTVSKKSQQKNLKKLCFFSFTIKIKQKIKKQNNKTNKHAQLPSRQ